MLQGINEYGEWWFPYKKELIFDGKLTFSQTNGGSLVIYGSEDPFIVLDTSVPGVQQQDKTLILGQLKDGRKVTLLSFVRSGMQSVRRNYYSFARRTFRIDFILIGYHFEKFDDIKFDSVSVQYSNIDNWLNLLSGHEISGRSVIQPTEPELGFTLKYYEGKRIDLRIENKCIIELFSYPVVNIDFGSKNKIDQKFYVKFRSLGGKTLDDYIILKGIFQDFLNFVMTHDVFVSKIVGDIFVNYNEHTLIEQIQIMYRSSISKRMDKIKVVSPYLPIFKLEKASKSEGLKDLIGGWFSLRNKIAAVYDLYFGVMYNYELYLTTKFLMLAQALEIYAGITSKEDDFIDEKVRQVNILIQQLDQANLSNESKEWIKDLIEEKRTMSFKEKIRYIYERYADLLPNLSHVVGTKEEFSKVVKSYRNKLTHGNIDYDQQKNEDLFWKFKDLQLILQLCILSELGFSIKELKTIYLIDKVKREA